MILEKIRKKKYKIWSFNEVEIPITDFNSGLKRKDELCICSSSLSTWTNIVQIVLNACAYHNRANAPVVTRAHPVVEVSGSKSWRTILFFQFRNSCLKCILVPTEHRKKPSAVVGLLR